MGEYVYKTTYVPEYEYEDQFTVYVCCSDCDEELDVSVDWDGDLNIIVDPCACKNSDDMYTEEQLEEAKSEAYNEGYEVGKNAGYDEGYAEAESEYGSNAELEEIPAAAPDPIEQYNLRAVRGR